MKTAHLIFSLLAVFGLAVGVEAYAKSSPLVGGLVVECTITQDYGAKDCTVVKTPSEDAEVMATIVKAIEAKWVDDGPYTQPGQRRTFTICDTTSKTTALQKKGLLCALYVPDEAPPSAYVGLSKSEIQYELDKQFIWQDTGVPVDMVKLPGSALMANAYPRKALDAKVGGGVIMMCHWTDDGSFDVCEVKAEFPKGFGFGETTARLFQKSARVKPVPGIPDDKRWMVYTYFWNLN